MSKVENQTTRAWLIAFIILMVAFFAAAIFLFLNPSEPGSYLYRVTDGFTGGVVSGIGQGFLFLFLTMHMSQLTEARVKLSTDILSKQADRMEAERKIAHFEEFLKTGNHYNVRFPDLIRGNQTLGLEYKIIPRRDASGLPTQHSTQLGPQYLVQVVAPAHERVLELDALLDYEDSPIKDGEFYFCSFFNGEWHMSQESHGDGDEIHRFYMSSKIGDIEHGQTANQYLGFNNEPTDKRQVFRMAVATDGTVLRGGGTADMFTAYVDARGGTYLKINDSPLKNIYMIDQEEAPEQWFLYVENFRGYKSAEYRGRVMALIEQKLGEAQVQPPRVPWHRFPG